jgi:hypothetical protein
MKIKILFGPVLFSKSTLYSESEYLSYEEINNDLLNEFILFYEKAKFRSDTQPKWLMTYLQAFFHYTENLIIIDDPKYVIGSHIGLYKNENILMPSLILQQDYVTVNKNKKIIITDEMINNMGSFIKELFHFEYLGFERF